MPRLEILVIDHYGREGTLQPPGPIIQTYKVYPDSPPGESYADFCALYEMWNICNSHDTAPDMVGFFGYRKYLCTWYAGNTTRWRQGHAPNFLECSRSEFDEYRDFMSTWDGAPIKELLAQYDILQGASFPLQINMITDLAQSRSEHDADVLRDTLRKHGIPSSSFKIYPYLFITRWSVFDRMMREMEPLRVELDELTSAVDDSKDEAYRVRHMAYIMERVYSQWLQNSGLTIKEVPLLHCWDL